jgi:hypothetical protein
VFPKGVENIFSDAVYSELILEVEHQHFVRFESLAFGNKKICCIHSPAELEEKSHMGFIEIMAVREFQRLIVRSEQSSGLTGRSL